MEDKHFTAMLNNALDLTANKVSLKRLIIL
jgi:hypothetical protein